MMSKPGSTSVLIVGLSVAALLFMPGALRAQSLGEQRVATSMLTFMKIGLGARAVSMGGAFTPVADDATTMFWNPAGLALLTEKRIHITHTDWPADIDYNVAFLTGPAKWIQGGVGLQIASLRTELDYTTEQQPLPNGRTFGFSDFLIGVGYAREFTTRFAFGGTIKYVREDLGSEVGGSVVSSWAGDVGTIFRLPFRNFKMTMAWTNIGPDFKPPGGFLSQPPGRENRAISYQSFSPTSVFAFGAALEPIQTRYVRLLTAVQFDHPADNQEQVKIGSELVFADMLALRAGWDPRSPEMKFSAGFGLRGALQDRVLHLDYAYTDGNTLGRIDRLSLELEF